MKAIHAEKAQGEKRPVDESTSWDGGDVVFSIT
jgi:hypothetical protein